ncbi:transporter, partial [Stenotrophomonas maltophilia]
PRVNQPFHAGVGVAQFDLDLFGPLRKNPEAARKKYHAVAANRPKAQLILVADKATAKQTNRSPAHRLKIAATT